MAEDSIIGRYARVRIDSGTDPLRDGLKLACRITGLSPIDPGDKTSSLRGEVVSNDVDGPLPARLLEASLIITPIGGEIPEGVILQGGSFRAKLGVLALDGNLIASGEGLLLRISEEIPFEGACPDCQGWKICEDCAGTGGTADARCPYCAGTGVCTRCRGTGLVTESD